MQFIANEPEPAGFDLVQQAYATACELPVLRPGRQRAGIARNDGRLVAIAEFDDLRRARLFAIQLGGLGYTEQDPEHTHAGCDVVFVPSFWTHGHASAGACMHAQRC